MTTLVWFREDLRTHDNPALHFADQQKTGVACVYLLDVNMWQKHHMAPIRMRFVQRGLAELSLQLSKKNISLHIIEINHEQEIAEKLFQYAKSINADMLVFNNQYEVNELHRDQIVDDFFKNQFLAVKRFDDQIIFKPELLHQIKGSPFKVFTPFKKNWLKHIYQFGLDNTLPAPAKQQKMIGIHDEVSIDITCEIADEIWPAGEISAQKRLTSFIENKISNYHEARDFPALDGTSKLSPYLSTGMISGKQCFHAALMFNQGEWDSGNIGATTWISELIWREFYKYILICFPHISKHLPFKLDTNNIAWEHNKNYLLAWQNGMTGFPLVDAAMRQLNQTGWMHNRLRMVVSMFLSKTLFIDWRLGEQYFMEHLIDGDLAANNGGWQWSASTGVDAAPYFRIFNPLRQSERFDSDGKFIRQYCPELSDLDNSLIHQPYRVKDLFTPEFDYPKPIVNHDLSKERVIRAFKNV